MDELTRWLDEQVYPRLSHQQVFGALPGFKRVGRGYVAVCPNPEHDDRHPSFYMRDGVPFGHCFGCGETISWWKYQEMKGLNGQQVIQELARLAGVPPLAGGDPEKAAKARAEAEAVEAWWQVARASIWRPEGADVLKYLRGRGYTDDQIRAMDVAARPSGPSPGGLKLPPPGYRLLIPARARGGRIVGFAGRRLDGSEPKYQYSPGFSRNGFLWGAYRLRDTDIPVVVEGILDSESIPAREVVALGGTVLSPAQAQALARHRRVILALDADDAGRKAMEAAVLKLAAAGAKVYVVPDFGGYKDPDEYVRANGPKAFAELCRHAVAGHKWQADRLLPVAPPADDLERDSVLEKALDLAEACHRTDPVAAKEVLDMAAARLGLDPVALAQAAERLAEKKQAQEAENLVRTALREAAATDDWREATRKVAEAREQAAALVQDAPKPLDPAAVEYEIAHAVEGLLYPWPELNRLCRVDPGGLTTVYAASGFGKTNFLYNLLLFYLEKYPHGAVVIWSGEMAARRVYQRLLAILSGVDYAEIGHGFRIGAHLPEVLAAREKLRLFSDRLYILEPLQYPDVIALESAVAVISRRQPVTAVMVDYLQQLAPPGKMDGSVKYGTREQEVTAVARELHGLGQARNIPVVAAVQINRAGGIQRKPQQDDARESGAIEQYSQLILGLWNAGRAGIHALRDGHVPVTPPDGWYWQDDDTATRQAAAMAESYGGTLVECAVLKSRYHGHENMAVPLVYFGNTGRIVSLPTVPGKLYVPGGSATGGDFGADKKGKKSGRKAACAVSLAGGE
ncbi:DnaB domain protein helicase domain protein [Desulfofundulus kuznetsovii DSM 6115]|uniref:DnaB domain protein helicase domain protein n=1 Tax=Desulfofundulus kuznetsovii (strain DSM 6115 / VKM B-1805 / 17) TaxID=760568 RepID=A0AAU8PD30_DESK7|nr:DnaB domain protein helicase domain protein [Desulfofundulus kuznetsovii DSM 6115]